MVCAAALTIGEAGEMLAIDGGPDGVGGVGDGVVGDDPPPLPQALVVATSTSPATERRVIRMSV
jgi:hypothetical protein